jgi:hypothetical protein
MLAAVIEQLRLLGGADQPAGQRPRLNPAVLVEFAKMRHRLLDDTPPDTNAGYQAPIAVSLSILFANRVAKVHAPSDHLGSERKYPRSALHAQIAPSRRPTP